MNKVLIITYYWPPSGGAGVQRWLKMSKYFENFGYNTYIIAPENANYPSIDESLVQDISKQIHVTKVPIWEPYSIFRKFIGISKDSKIKHTFSFDNNESTWKSKVALWIKCNIFIPDPRIFWLFAVIPKAKKLIKDHNIDSIITTSPPNSIHLIGMILSRILKGKVKWIADFRDPWTNVYYEDTLPYTYISKKINQLMEKTVLKNATKIITVSPFIQESLRKKINKNNVYCLTNGYDHVDFTYPKYYSYDKFRISYIGTLFKMYNMPMLWEALGELIIENPIMKKHLEINIAGEIDHSVYEQLKFNNLTENLVTYGYVSHSEIFEIMKRTTVFALTTPQLNDEGILTGKVFEYLANLKPILCITSQNNNLWNLIKNTKSGYCASHMDKPLIKSHVTHLFDQYINKTLTLNDESNIVQYSRQKIAESVIELLKSN